MAKKTLFRAALFGGYNKEDVHEYIQTLENEIEAVKVLNQKEKNDLLRQLEESKEKQEESTDAKEELQRTKEKSAGLEEELRRKEEESAGLEQELQKMKEEAAIFQEELEKARKELSERLEAPALDAEAEAERLPGSEEAENEEYASYVSAQREKVRLLSENAELKARLEALNKELEAMGEQADSAREGDSDDFFDYRTVTKIIEEAHRNAELIREEAQRQSEQIVEKAIEDAEKQKGVIAARINMELEEKGIQLIAAKHKIDQYMKEVNSAQQGLYNIYTRMNRMIENMPIRLDDYWDGEHYRALEKMRESEGETEGKKKDSAGEDIAGQ